MAGRRVKVRDTCAGLSVPFGHKDCSLPIIKSARNLEFKGIRHLAFMAS